MQTKFYMAIDKNDDHTEHYTRSTLSSHKVNLLVVHHHGVNPYPEKIFAFCGTSPVESTIDR